MTKMTVGLCQMPVTADKEANLRTARAYVERCAGAGAELVVLPEMFCCPYQNSAFPAYAEEAGEEVWQFLSRTARELGIYLVGGSVPEREAGRLYNTSFVFGSEGQQLCRHRKMHLFDINVRGGQSFRESDVLAPGSEVTVFDTPWGRVGVMICFDVRCPELCRLMALEGARVAVIPGAFNMTTGPIHWELHMRGRAVDNQLFTLACAPAREEGAGYVSYGNSMAVSPWGTILGRLDAAGDILVAELDMDEVDKVRRQLPLLSARREDVYHLGLCGTKG